MAKDIIIQDVPVREKRKAKRSKVRFAQRESIPFYQAPQPPAFNPLYYRMLNPEECLKRQDEFWDGQKWTETLFLGRSTRDINKLINSNHMYRRQITYG